jgi:uncharacterized protein (TIGR03435 family)
MAQTFGIAILLAANYASSQVTTETKLVFDIASIKPSDSSARQGLIIQPGGRFVASSFSLQSLIAIAYHLTPFQISSVAGWIANERWNIEAKGEGVTSIPSWVPPDIPEMMAVRLRTLLDERFLLKVHREARLQEVYALTLAKNGSKLVSVEPASSTQQRSAQRGGTFRAGPGVVIGAAVTMDQIVKYLDRLMDRRVIDKTGLTGYFDLTLKFAPESAPRYISSPAATAGVGIDAEVSDDPTIFTALQEQLGLKLQLAKEPTEFLVIDSARKPTDN